MKFTSHNDLDLLIKMEHHGRPIRVADCVRFAVKVWTQNPNNFLFFTARDVIKDDRFDRLVIPGYQMAALESGVVMYEYSCSLTDRHFKPFEGHPHDHRNRVVTDQYWKNCNLNQTPSNPVNYQTLNHLRNLIEQEVADRENAIIDVKQYLDESFVNDLRAEIKRSNEVDAELNNKINETKAATDEAIKAVSDKLDAEVKRSNEVDIELFNAIKKAGQNTDDIKQETDGKIEETNAAITAEADRAKEAEKQLNDAIVAEADRAKAAEREINTALTDEVSRAKTKEAEIDGVIAAEVSRAKVVEGALTDGLDAVRDKANQIASDLAAEVSRSNQKDNDHTAAVNTEVTRATAAEKAITDRLDVIEGDATVIGSLAHTLEDAKHYTDDAVSKANADNATAIADNTNAIAAEVSRATTAEKALADRLDTAEANLNDTADTLVNLTNKDTEITNALNAEVSRAQTAEKANADAITSLDSKVDDVKATADKAAADITAEVSRATTKEGELSTSIASEASRAQTKEGELEAALNVVNGDKDTIGSIAHAVEDANHYTDDEIAKLSTATATNLADALKPYATKAEVDGRIEGLIGTAPAALDTLGEIADRLAEDNDAIAAINGVLNGKANSADVYTKAEVDAQHTTITTSVTALDGKVDAEADRAKAAEKVNADNLTALSTKVDAVKAVSDKAAADLTDEVNRAKAAEADLTTKVNAEVTRATAAEKAITDRLDVIEGDKDVVGSITHSLEDAKQYTDDAISKANAESNAAIADNATAIANEVSRATAAEKALSDRLDVAETALNDTADALANLTAKDTEITNALNSEVSRAQTAEKANADAVTALDGKVDGVKTVADKAAADITAEVSRATTKEGELSTAIASEVSRAQTKEGELSTAIAVINGDENVIGSLAHTLEDSKHYTDDEITKLSTATATNLADALKPYATKQEVDGRIEGIIGTAPAALDTLGEIADRLAEDNDAINAINGVLNGKANASDVYTKSEVDAQHTTITTSVTALDGKVDAEADRAKAAEKVNADNLTALSTKVDTVKATADKAAADLTDEVNRAKAAEAELSTKLNAVEAKADTNADGIASLVDDVATLETALNGAKTDINGLTNDLSAEVSRAQTKEGELEAGITANAQKVADITTRTTAVEGEVNTLSNDVDAVEAAVAIINGDETVIGSIKHGVADSKHYTDDEIAKLTAKVDASVTGFATKTEVANVDAKVDALTTKVNSIETVDAYTKAEVDEMIANVDVTDQLTDYAKTADVAAAYQPKGDYLVAADITGKADKSDTYTKAEVDTLGNQLKAIAEARLPIDSFNTWSEGVAMKNATTVIKDEAGNVITEMVIDNSAADDTIEVYTKAQVDEMFANVPKIVNLTQSEYDALTTKAPNTLYIVNG